MTPDQTSPDAASPRALPPARIRTRAPTGPALADPDTVANEYEVGYGKPPKHTRFAPGMSGNRRGRPKGSRSLATLVAEGLDKPITAKIGRRTVTMRRREALVHRLIEQALGGDLRSVALLLKLDPGATTPDDTTAPAEQHLSPEEAALLQAFLRRQDSDEGQ